MFVDLLADILFFTRGKLGVIDVEVDEYTGAYSELLMGSVIMQFSLELQKHQPRKNWQTAYRCT